MSTLFDSGAEMHTLRQPLAGADGVSTAIGILWRMAGCEQVGMTAKESSDRPSTYSSGVTSYLCIERGIYRYIDTPFNTQHLCEISLYFISNPRV